MKRMRIRDEYNGGENECNVSRKKEEKNQRRPGQCLLHMISIIVPFGVQRALFLNPFFHYSRVISKTVAK